MGSDKKTDGLEKKGSTIRMLLRIAMYWNSGDEDKASVEEDDKMKKKFLYLSFSVPRSECWVKITHKVIYELCMGGWVV